MTIYTYKSIDETGASVSGEIEADSRELAGSILEARGFLPTQIQETGGEAAGFTLSRLKEVLTPVKTPELILLQTVQDHAPGGRAHGQAVEDP